MHAHELRAGNRAQYRSHGSVERRPVAPGALIALGLVAVTVFAVDAVRGGGSPAPSQLAFSAAPATAAPAPPASVAEQVDMEGCTIDVIAVKVGDQGEAVECVQKALTVSGDYSGPIDGVFSDAVEAAATQFQTKSGLYVDGIVGRRTSEQLGIWPGDESFIVRTPPPSAGAMDSWGYELSSVATTGADAPPLPPGADQATGKRVVYYRAGQRVWAIDDDEQIVRSYLVSGSQYNNERPGVHSVYSKSEMATGWNFQADLPLMVRYLETDRGHIGFHQIPIHKADGTTYQDESELGTRLSGGCQRQAPLDAIFMWNFADVGTTVIVI